MDEAPTTYPCYYASPANADTPFLRGTATESSGDVLCGDGGKDKEVNVDVGGGDVDEAGCSARYTVYVLVNGKSM